MSSSIVITINLALAPKLIEELKFRNCEISIPPHTVFSAKKSGLSCTLYQSGKCVIQGKESAEFIEFYLEPNILKTFALTNPLANLDLTPRIGIDESGKGDFFGPLCIAGVFVPSESFSRLKELGVKDSKTMSELTIRKIGIAIKKEFAYQVVKINPPKYNQIYAEFKNLNRLLAWGHATTIEQLVERTQCKKVLIDQFADEWVVESALKRKKVMVELTQRHRGEEDLAVAAASIIARLAFIEGMEQLSEQMGMILPKGCSAATKKVATQILVRFGEEKLRSICKEHFKTLDAILGKITE